MGATVVPLNSARETTMSDDYAPAARALVAAGVSARELADHAQAVVGATGTELAVAERIRAARFLRLLAMEVVDRTVIASLLDGAPADEVADALGLDPAMVEQRYGPAVAAWSRPELSEQRGPGDAGDRDVAGTAAALDQWWVRHQETANPLVEDVPDPVSRALNRR